MSLQVAGKVVLCRTKPLGTGMRGVLYLPADRSVHILEDRPIPAGVYCLCPDTTGRFQHFVVLSEALPTSRIAVPPVVDDQGIEVEPPRTDIELHPGPRVGPTTLKHTAGCMCPGLATVAAGVVESVEAMAVVREQLQRDTPAPPSWVLEIVE